MDERMIQQMIRSEVNNFFDRTEGLMQMANDHQLKILALLPEPARLEFLLRSQSMASEIVQNTMNQTFTFINKISDQKAR
jgi:hypothetical protein